MSKGTAWERFVCFGFRLLYNELAWTYDAVSWLVSLGEWRCWQFAALDFVAGDRVLEIAHGTGHLLPALGARHRQVVGLDLSPHMGRIASGRSGRLGLSVSLLRSSAMTLPFAAGSFDSIVTTFPTNFIFEAETLAAVRRVLADGGRLVVVPSGGLKGNGFVERLIAWLFVVTGQDGEDSAEDVYAEWQSHFAAQGFALEIHQIDLEKSRAVVLTARPD